MIESVVDKLMTNEIYSKFNLDIDGFVHNKKEIKTLWFEYPFVDFFIPVFMEFIESINSNSIYMTDGANIKEDECYLKFDKIDFIKFIRTNDTYTSAKGYKHIIDDYYLIGLTIFDETLTWLIHKNPDEADITFSYQYEKFNNVEMLIQNEWFTEST